LNSSTGKLSGLVSDARGRFLVRPSPAKRLLIKAAKEKRPAFHPPPETGPDR